jgi:hypothetical protein
MGRVTKAVATTDLLALATQLERAVKAREAEQAALEQKRAAKRAARVERAMNPKPKRRRGRPLGAADKQPRKQRQPRTFDIFTFCKEKLAYHPELGNKHGSPGLLSRCTMVREKRFVTDYRVGEALPDARQVWVRKDSLQDATHTMYYAYKRPNENYLMVRCGDEDFYAHDCVYIIQLGRLPEPGEVQYRNGDKYDLSWGNICP